MMATPTCFRHYHHHPEVMWCQNQRAYVKILCVILAVNGFVVLSSSKEKVIALQIKVGKVRNKVFVSAAKQERG